MHPGLQVALRLCGVDCAALPEIWRHACFSGGDAGLPLLLKQLPSLQAAGYILHSRWFSNETDYAKPNGGKFSFAVEHDSAAFPGNGVSRCCQMLLRCAFTYTLLASHNVI